MGVSGGEEGALWGPSLMPGGPKEAYDVLEPMLIAIAAKSDDGPCVTYIGPGGSGHYVKMVHNGIEYGDMQLIAETYDIMRPRSACRAAEIADVFADWNTRELASYLIEVTADVLRYIDPDTGQPLVDVILDAAEQKGTGRWTMRERAGAGSPVPTIDAAVTARMLRRCEDARLQASEILAGPAPRGPQAAAVLDWRDGLIELGTRRALYFAKISLLRPGHGAAARGQRRLHLESRICPRSPASGPAAASSAPKLLADIMRAYRDNPRAAESAARPRRSRSSRTQTAAGVAAGHRGARGTGACRCRR